MAKSIPDGYHAVTPHLVIRDCAAALTFYEKAFGARILHTSPGPSGKLMHAAIQIGDSILMMADEFPEMGERFEKSPTALGGTTAVLTIYCDDTDAWFARAVEAGAQPSMQPADMFWGDRYGQVRDPFGHSWAIATHLEDLTPEQIAERQGQWMAETASK